tara:strand:- start:900 stop:2099 length:1200 start_codon:yes stop_codon:yes gene_type:complete
MKKNINNYLISYLLILLIFSYFYLYIKHTILNDSTISEWLINYEGGFTKRGLVGQLAIIQSRIFDIDLRWSIFLLQSLSCTIYFGLLYILFKNIKTNRVINLAIFTPIFILYPIAEIEVLARKEIIVFSLFITYIFIPRTNKLKNFSLMIFLILSILVWEPIIFFFPLILLFEIIENNIKKINLEFFKCVLFFLPSFVIALNFMLNPLSSEEHKIMSTVLENEFGQACYMSCGLLESKSTVIQQFEGNFGKYSFKVFFRYSLIIIIGFLPILILLNNSTLKNKNLLFLKYFKNLIFPISICFVPVILLFAMGYDWGRWVNISYVVLALIYFSLYKKNIIKLNIQNLEKNLVYKLKGKIFIIFFVIYCFGWNQKTVITGDVASFPGYRIPYKAIKIFFNK